MIDIENAVFNKVATDLRAEFLSRYPKLKVYGEYVEYPEEFPCVTMWMADNYTDLRSRELHDTADRYVNVMFTTEVYAVGTGKKAITKELANFIDELMLEMGFTRSAMLILPNSDRNVGRITMRHTALAGRPLEVGGEDELISLLYR